MKITRRLCIVAVCLGFGSTTASAQDLPVKRWFTDASAKSAFTRSFVPLTPFSGTVEIYLMVGDIGESFDKQSFRPDSTIAPTNTNLALQAPFPTTQKTLMARVARAPQTLQDLLHQADVERKQNGPDAGASTSVIPIGIGTFTAQLKPSSPPTDRFPRFVCFVATDYPAGGSSADRDLVTQDSVRIGIKNCLVSLDSRGVQSVVMPLIGAASGATRTKALLDPNERDLLRCRLINSISGIALGISDFAPARRSIVEIGIVQYGEDIERLFSPPKTSNEDLKSAFKQEYEAYADNVKATLLRALAGTKTTGDDLHDRDCNRILGFPDQDEKQVK